MQQILRQPRAYKQGYHSLIRVREGSHGTDYQIRARVGDSGTGWPCVAKPPQATIDHLPEFDAAYIVPTSLDDLPRRPNGMPLPLHGFGPQGGPGTSEPGQLVCTHCSLELFIVVAFEKSPPAITVLDGMRDELYGRQAPSEASGFCFWRAGIGNGSSGAAVTSLSGRLSFQSRRQR